MRALVAFTLVLSLFSASLARAEEPPAGEPPPDKVHAWKMRLGGMITADIGVVALVAGVIMLGVATAPSIDNDVPKRNGLNLAGGMCVGVGAGAAVVGLLVWLLGRKEAKAVGADPNALKLTFAPTGVGIRF